MIKRLCLSGILLIAIYGCGSSVPPIPTLYVQYNSFPESARLLCVNANGVFQDQGYTPTTLQYRITDIELQNGYVQTSPCKAVWVGGANEDYPVKFTVTPNGASYTTHVSSKSVKKIDIQFDGQRKQAAAIERQAAAISSASESKNTWRVQNPYSYVPRTTYCNTYGTLTTCF